LVYILLAVFHLKGSFLHNKENNNERAVTLLLSASADSRLENDELIPKGWKTYNNKA
jgi:hypothetical protein